MNHILILNNLWGINIYSLKYAHLYANNWGAQGVIVIVIEYVYGIQSSNPGQDCLLIPLGKVCIQLFSLQL